MNGTPAFRASGVNETVIPHSNRTYFLMGLFIISLDLDQVWTELHFIQLDMIWIVVFLVVPAAP